MNAPAISNLQQLKNLDALRDQAVCGCSLIDDSATRFAEDGAHDPTATYYFVLEDLFRNFHFTAESRLLDVGCGAGRALAYFATAGFPGHATGVELDPGLAQRCQSWARAYPNLSVVAGSVLDLPLSEFTDFYLFNPFDNHVLVRFIEKLEAEATKAITLCHMSDNGDTYTYLVRPGWKMLKQGEFHTHGGVAAYAHPQHYSAWIFTPQKHRCDSRPTSNGV